MTICIMANHRKIYVRNFNDICSKKTAKVCDDYFFVVVLIECAVYSRTDETNKYE